MKMLLPEPEVKLYEEGFEEPDILQRRATGKSLSQLVERIEDPVVLALDGGWGTGKSYFLKRWVGAHTLENEGTATTVYFDAFAHDYLSDPLPALVSTLGERLESANKSALARAATAAFKLAKPLAQVGLKVASFGATDVLSPIGDAITEAVEGEASEALKTYWRKEDGRRAAMEEFREALTDLVEAEDEAASGARLVIVVDELDRCRPDYALEVLEVIKHFFACPRVMFILGVKLEALENSVRARYGAGIDASAYLRKFINVTFSLPDEVGERQQARAAALVYLDHMSAEMGVPRHIQKVLRPHLALVMRNNDVSIRDVGKILSAVTLLGGDVLTNENILTGWLDVMVGLLVAKVVDQKIYNKFKYLNITSVDLEQYFEATPDRITPPAAGEPRGNYDLETLIQYHSWLYVKTDGQFQIDNQRLANHIQGRFSNWALDDGEGRDIVRKIQREWLDVFERFASG